MITREQIKEIVTRTINAYFTQAKSESKHIAVLLISRTTQERQVLDTLQALCQVKDEVTIVSCSDWSDKLVPLKLTYHKHIRFDQLKAEEDTTLLHQLQAADVIVLPNLSLAMLAKLALSIDDTLAAWLMIQLQLKGKQIIIATDNVEGDLNQLLTTPNTVDQRITGYLQQLRRDGIKLTTLSRLNQTVRGNLAINQAKKPVLLAKHVEKSYQHGHKEIELPENVVITPLAKDTSKELRVSLSKKRKGGLNDRS